MLPFSIIACICVTAAIPAVLASKCAKVLPLETLDLVEYARATWYIQEQQVTKYQKKGELNCVLATYDADQSIKSLVVPFFDGPVIGIYNYANKGSVEIKCC